MLLLYRNYSLSVNRNHTYLQIGIILINSRSRCATALVSIRETLCTRILHPFPLRFQHRGEASGIRT